MEQKLFKKIRELGYMYIEGDTTKIKNKITIEDSNGYRYFIMIERLLSDKPFTPYIFRDTNPYTIYNTKIFLKSIDSKTEVLSTSYSKKDYGKIKFKCCCGEEFERSLAMVVYKNRHLCEKCSRESMAKQQRLPFKQIEQVFIKNGLTIIDKTKEYGTKDNIPCVNSEGFKATVSYSRLNRENNPTILYIHKNNPYTIDNINLTLEKQGLKLKVVSTQYVNNLSELEWECLECGHKYKRSWANHIGNGVKICPNCVLKNTSFMAYSVCSFLTQNNIEFEREKRFDDCKFKKPLPFDFYLPKHNIFIEVDGKQHFEKIRFGNETEEELESKFQSRKRNDKIKNQYAIANNIKLIRLPYWQFENNLYINILKKELNINKNTQ